MAEARILITAPNLILVEGKDEVLILGALVRAEGIQGVQVISFEGKQRLPGFLKSLVRTHNVLSVRSIGVVRDADANPEGALKSVRDALSRVGLPTPQAPLSPASGPPRVTLMILPGASRPGALEDLCLEAVAGDPAFPCLAKYFDCLKEVGMEGPRNLSRARMQVFLASRSEAGKRLGEAAQAGYLPWDAPAFAELRTFLQTVSR